MNYYELRSKVAKILPRRTMLEGDVSSQMELKEKGRKTNYCEWNLEEKKLIKSERLLDTEEIHSFVEVSLRASACPMPLNLDVYDGLLCGFGCRYCFADSFRASLYSAFFDNGKSLGIRHCNPDYYKIELAKLISLKGSTPKGNEVQRAFCLGVPLRFGIRFEDFLPIEGKKKISLTLLEFLKESHYPLMINTKSDLVGREDYVKALADNPAKAAVHITLISSDDILLKKLEPGAPSYKRRLETMRILSSAGVRVVARIEPWMVFINDEKDKVEQYIEEVWDAGVRHITFDTYSWSAKNPGIRRAFYDQGYDFERMFLLSCDSQWLGSLLLGEFMKLFRDKGFSCSTFDLGNVTDNDDGVCCCEVGDGYFGDAGFNHGSIVRAMRFIQERGSKVTTWNDFDQWVESKGGWLSEKLKKDVYDLFSLTGNTSYFVNWARGIEGKNGGWSYSDEDYRKQLLEGIL